jgi:hypothetical protein
MSPSTKLSDATLPAGADIERYRYLLALFILLLASLYGLNVFGNLRLNTDAVTILSSALSDSRGSGRIFHGEPTVYPPGYPFIVELQLMAGISSSYTLVLFNWLLLLVGVASFVLLLRTAFGLSSSIALLFGCLVMLNWIFVKHAPLPITDIPYFGVAFLSLWVIERARGAKSDGTAFFMFLLGWLLVFACIGIRRVGISLVPVWIAALATRPGWFHRVTASSRWMQTIIAVVLLVPICVLLAWFWETVTLRDYHGSPSVSGVLVNTIRALLLHTRGAGEVILNLPRSKLPPSMGVAFLIIGAIAIALASIGLVRHRRLGVIEIYCLAYAAIMLAWPASDPRTLIPIVPFLFVYAFNGTESLGLGQWHNRLLVAWAILYTVAGLAALFFSARITFAGKEFPVVYGDWHLRPTYCAFLKTCPVENPLAIDSDALELLETFQVR